MRIDDAQAQAYLAARRPDDAVKRVAEAVMWMRGRRCSADEAMSRSEDIMLSLYERSCCAADPFETVVRAM